MTPSPPARNCTTCLMTTPQAREPATHVTTDQHGLRRYACALCASAAAKQGEAIMTIATFWTEMIISDAEQRLRE